MTSAEATTNHHAMEDESMKITDVFVVSETKDYGVELDADQMFTPGNRSLRGSRRRKKNVPTIFEDESENNDLSCIPAFNESSVMDLSWLSASVVQCAMEDKNASLKDMSYIHESLRWAEKFGSVSHQVAKHLRRQISKKETLLMEKFIEEEAHAFLKVLGLGKVASQFLWWSDGLKMLEGDGPGQAVLMKDYKGLGQDEVKQALEKLDACVAAFRNNGMRHDTYEKSFNGLESSSFSLSDPMMASLREMGEESIRRAPEDPQLMEKAMVGVKDRINEIYEQFYLSAMDTNVSGYDPEFLKDTLQVNPEEFRSLL